MASGFFLAHRLPLAGEKAHCDPGRWSRQAVLNIFDVGYFSSGLDQGPPQSVWFTGPLLQERTKPGGAYGRRRVRACRGRGC